MAFSDDEVERSFDPYRNGFPTAPGVVTGVVVRKDNLDAFREVLDPGLAGERVATLAHELADERSLLTQLATKEMIASITETGAVGPDVAAHWAAVSTEATDAAEGLHAFLERRPPRFTWTP